MGTGGREKTESGGCVGGARAGGPCHGSGEPASGMDEAIDTRGLLDRCMGDVGLANLVLSKLREQLARDEAELERLVGACDLAGLGRVLHGLKGAAASASAGPLREVAASMERIVQGGDMHSARTLLAHLHDEAERLRRCPALGEHDHGHGPIPGADESERRP